MEPLGQCSTAYLRRWSGRAGMKLSGDVEVDETSIGGVKSGKRGRSATGKTLVAVAVERRSPRGFGRCRLQVIPDATAPTLERFLADNVSRAQQSSATD